MQPTQLRDLRKMHGLLQSDVAIAIGVDKQTVNRWEKGRTKIKGRYERLILDLMSDKVMIDYLIHFRSPRKSRGRPFQKKGE